VGLSSAVGAAITNHRTLGAAEAKAMGGGGILLVLIAIVALLWPRLLTVPLAVLLLWVAAALFARAWRLRHGGER
jgi:cardiolipin synthase